MEEIQPHVDYDLAYPVDSLELEELARLLQQPMRNINRCHSKGQMREANAQLLLKIGLLTKQMHRMAGHLNQLAPQDHKVEDDDRVVSFQVSQETKEELVEHLLEYYFDNGAFSGESIHQSDACQVESTNTLAYIADHILKFNVSYKEE